MSSRKLGHDTVQTILEEGGLWNSEALKQLIDSVASPTPADHQRARTVASVLSSRTTARSALELKDAIDAHRLSLNAVADSSELHAKWMRRLTWAPVIATIVTAGAAIITAISALE